MYTREEYKRRIQELFPVAQEIVERKTPDEAREEISKMIPEDAYIIGMWLGKLLVLDELAHAVTSIVVPKVERRIPFVQNPN
jgi:hypothetical protein